jgi:3-oxoacyl-[acyl-carrier-protein] synthase-3
MADRTARIVSTGSYLPPYVLNNEDLKQFPAEALVLIEKKTGVRQRHHASPEQMTSDLAASAGRACLQRAGIEAASVDAIVLATSSPDRIQPATATRVQQLLGATRAFAFDLNAVCSGFVYGLQVCTSLIESGACRRVLLEAAGPDSTNAGRVVRSILHADGSGTDVIQIPAGGTMQPIGQMKSAAEAYFRMNGRQVYAFAVSKGVEVLKELCAATQVNIADVKLIIPHQANINIIRELANGLGIPESTFFVNLDHVGNTAAASIPLALDEANTAGRISAGDKVALVAFGGGLSWGASLIQY